MLDGLGGRLIVSCRPVTGGPMDRPGTVAMADCATDARGLSAAADLALDDATPNRRIPACPA